jgi:hypothetical protein
MTEKTTKTKTTTNLPYEIRAWLKAQAELHQSNMTSELVRAVRQRMESLRA